jgi:hypothetical protein
VKVKDWRVVEEVSKRFVVVAPPYMVRPPPSVPLPMVEDAIDWNPFKRPRDVSDDERTFDARVVPVRLPAGAEPEMFPVRLPVRLPTPDVKNKLVVEAVVAKKFVDVAFVVVALIAVKFCSVVELFASIVFAVSVPTVPFVAKRFVEDAVPTVLLVAKKLVVVAFVPVALVKVKFWRVVEERERNCWNEDMAVVLVATKLVAVVVPLISRRELVVVAVLPMTTAIFVPPFGYIERPLVEVAHFELGAGTVLHPNCPVVPV